MYSLQIIKVWTEIYIVSCFEILSAINTMVDEFTEGLSVLIHGTIVPYVSVERSVELSPVTELIEWKT